MCSAGETVRSEVFPGKSTSCHAPSDMSYAQYPKRCPCVLCTDDSWLNEVIADLLLAWGSLDKVDNYTKMNAWANPNYMFYLNTLGLMTNASSLHSPCRWIVYGNSSIPMSLLSRSTDMYRNWEVSVLWQPLSSSHMTVPAVRKPAARVPTMPQEAWCASRRGEETRAALQHIRAGDFNDAIVMRTHVHAESYVMWVHTYGMHATRLSVCLYVCMFVWSHVCMSVCVYVCICVCVYVCW